MKKYIIMVLVIASLLVAGLVVYAETTEVEMPEWYPQMLEWRRGEIENALEDGSLTEAEAEEWLERMDDMEANHLEEGFEGYGPGSCSVGNGNSVSGRGFGGGCRGGGFKR